MFYLFPSPCSDLVELLGCVKLPVFGEGSRTASGIATQEAFPVQPTIDNVVTVNTFRVIIYMYDVYRVIFASTNSFVPLSFCPDTVTCI